MKRILVLLTVALGIGQITLAQDRYFTRDGKVEFFSATPVENIEAVNDKLTAVLDFTSGAFEFSVLIKSFEFEKALMEEHFNENYMESTKFPKATFVGTIVDFAQIRDANFPPGVEMMAKGKLTIHGVTRDVVLVGYVVEADGGYTISSSFVVKPEDHDIEIPNAVRNNIAKEIQVTVSALLKPLTK